MSSCLLSHSGEARANGGSNTLHSHAHTFVVVSVAVHVVALAVERGVLFVRQVRAVEPVRSAEALHPGDIHDAAHGGVHPIGEMRCSLRVGSKVS